MRKTIGKILILAVVTFFIGFICVYFFYIVPQKNLINHSNFSISLNSKNYVFSLLAYKNDDQIEHQLVYKKNSFSETKVVLSGFEDAVALCQDKTVNLGGGLGDAICFTYSVGVHSQNLALILLKDEKLVPVNFVDQTGLETPNIFSDEPALFFNDYDNDGLPDVVVGNRNYDNDPLSDVTRSYYKNTGQNFVFDKALNFTYHSN